MSLHVPIPTWDGDEENAAVIWVDADELTADERSDAARMINAVGRVLSHSEPDATSEFEGRQIGDHTLVTDPDVLQQLAEAGEFTFDEFYWDSGNTG